MNRVLLVDDDSDLRALVRQCLEADGHDVTEASSGVEALEYLASGIDTPNLVLLDMQMPEMDGDEVLAELARDASLQTIPVVVFSAHPHDGAPPKGVRGMIRKPIDLESLTTLVRKFCRDR